MSIGNNMKPKRFVNSVGKAAQIIDAFCKKEELSITELSKMLDYYPSVIHRFCTTLEYLGYVEQNQDNGKYRLGLKLLKLGNLVFNRIDLRQRIRPILKELANNSGETANLAIFNEKTEEAIFIDQIESSMDIKMSLRVGSKAGLHSTAVGKVIFAHLSNEKIDELIKKKEFPRLTKNTIVEPEELRKELSLIRKRGYSIDNEESILGAKCIACPVKDHTKQVVAGISISAPSSRIDDEYIDEKIDLVKKSTLKASLRLGYVQ